MLIFNGKLGNIFFSVFFNEICGLYVNLRTKPGQIFYTCHFQ